MDIALMGHARAGKDLVGEMIINQLFEKTEGCAKRFAFGDELRCKIYEAFPELDNLEKKPRQFFETFAQLGRDIDEDIWIKHLDREMFDTLNKLYKHKIITDLRQPDEAEYCRSKGFKIVEVYAPEDLRKDRSKNDTNWVPVNHSERFLHLIKPDYVIHNLHDTKNTEEQVKYMLERLFNI